MAETSGIGFGVVRSALYISGIFILLISILINSFNKKIDHPNITNKILFILILTIFIVVVRVLIDFIEYSKLDYIGLFPIAEFIISLFIFSRLNIYDWLNENIEKIKIISIIFMLIDIFIWIYSIWQGISFGVFRANISGLELNRMPDLFYAGIASFILIDKNSHLSSRLISLLTIMITLYRSAYLCALSVLIYGFYYYGRNLNLKKLIYYILLVILLSYLFLRILGHYFIQDNSLEEIIFQRILSTIQPEESVSGESSKSLRMDQISPLIIAFCENFIFGGGFSFELLGEPIYNYFNYILILLVIFGFPIILALIYPVIILIRLLKFREFTSNSGILLVNSMVLYFFVLINIFPYMVYFPISSVFAFSICYYFWRQRITRRPI